MKNIVFISLAVLLLFNSQVLSAQEKSTAKVFAKAEQMPQFPGGEKALYQWLNENLTYPAEAVKKEIQGTVTLRFVVKEDGSIGDIEILRSVSPELDAESLRVVEALPQFIPARQNGEPVAVWFTMPIRFRLPAEKTEPTE